MNGHRFFRLLATLLMAGLSLLVLPGCGGLAGSQTGPGAGSIAIGNATLSFGSVVIGSTKTLSDSITNNTSSSVTVSSIQGLGSGFQVGGVSLPLTLTAGQTITFNVQFQPSATGAPTATISFRDANAQQIVSLSANAKAVTVGSLLPSPSQVSFGNTKVGAHQASTVTLTNNGGSDLTITKATLSGAGFSMTNLGVPLTLQAGKASSSTVTFAPTGSGTFNGSVTFAVTSDQQDSNIVVKFAGDGVAAGVLTAAPTSLAFGSVEVGSNSSKGITLTNTGGTATTISQATASGAGFSVSGLTLPVTLAPNQSATASVTFAPSAAGAASGSVNIVSDASNSPASIALSGTGQAAGALTASPSSVNFGSVTVGSNKTVAVSVTNTGGSSVSLSSATAKGSGFNVTGPSLPLTLNAGQSATFNAVFAPSATGAASGALSIISNASNTTLSVPLSGTGIAAGQLSSTPASFAFGSVQIGTPKSLSGTLTNSGGTSLTISAASASGSGFSLSGLTLPVALAAGQSTSFTVIFSPASGGGASGSVSITSNGGNPNLTIPLTGTGVTPGALSSNPTNLAFGTVQVGNSTSLSETLTNSGGSSLTISAASASGAGFSLSGLSLPITLSAGQSTSFNVSFAPSASGAASGNVSVTSNGGNPNLNVPLTGNGVAQGALTSNPTSLAFGNVIVGNSKSLSETLTNSGGTSLTISAASATGAGFSLSGLTLPVTLSAGQSTSFTISFAPSATGSVSGNISVTSTASNPDLSIPLSGSGVTQGTLGANPTNLSFGNVQVGNNSALSETLTNTGGTSLTISSATASGTGFSLSGLALPVTLNAGQSTSFTVTFTPAGSGGASGNISIVSNGSNPSLNIPLAGTGVTAGTISANPSSMAFGSVQVGNSASLSQTLTNTGGSSLTISAASASGTGFSLSGLALPITLNAGQSTSFTVSFNPSAGGAASGSVSVTSNGGNPNLTIPLTGNGVTQGTLSPNPSALAFGSVQVGNGSNLSETLTNTGGSSLTISAATASGSGFSLSGLALPVTLSAGQSTSFTLSFNPSAGGAASGSVSVTSNGANPNLTITLTGNGVTLGALSPNPSSLTFGSVQVGNSQNLSEILSNTGGSPVTITQANLSGASFSISGLSLPLTLTPNQSVTFTTTFTPTGSGAASGNLAIVSNGSNPTLSIALSGTGAAAGQLAVSPAALAFGNVVVGSNSSLSGSLNATGASVTVSSASLNNAEFVLSGISLPLTLAAGQSAPFTVKFTPQASGATSGTLSFVSNASNSPAVQTMTGTGTAPVQHTVDLSWSAASGAVGYNVYRGTVSGGPYFMINTSLDGATAFTDNTVVSGQTYYYVATAVDGSSNESGYSNQAQAVVPSP